MKITYTEIQRLALINDVASQMFDATESWENEIGGFLAYLFWVISANVEGHKVVLADEFPQSSRLINEIFPKDHPIFSFIDS